MIDLIATPNARLLYQEVPVSDLLGYQRWVGQLELALAKSGRARAASTAAYLYFFDFPSGADFWNLGCWVAVEMIGPVEVTWYAGTDYPLQSFDLQQGEVYQLRIPGPNATMDEVFEMVEMARAWVDPDGEDLLAPTWRLCLDQGEMVIQLFPEF